MIKDTAIGLFRAYKSYRGRKGELLEKTDHRPRGKEDTNMGKWAWDFETLTPEERREYDDLQEEWQKAEDEQRYDSQRDTEKQINDFIDRMNDKYARRH